MQIVCRRLAAVPSVDDLTVSNSGCTARTAVDAVQGVPGQHGRQDGYASQQGSLDGHVGSVDGPQLPPVA